MDATSIDNRMLAGISVPATAIVDRATEYARRECEPYLFSHVVRSWLFAARACARSGNLDHNHHHDIDGHPKSIAQHK